MDILELICDRRTIQSYMKHEVPLEVIEQAVVAAIHAPNHKLTFPWRFYLVKGPARERLADLNVKLKSEQKALSEVEIQAVRAKFMEPGALVVASLVRCDDPARAREDYASLACALQNMSLFLWDREFGSKWGTGKVIRHAETYKILGIDPQREEICGFFWIGKFKAKPPKPVRPELKNFFSIVE